MAGEKFLFLSSGKVTEKASLDTSAGAADAGKVIATDSGGKLPVSMLPNGVGPLVKNVVSSENLAARDMVNLYNNAGTLNVRKADADNNMPVHGYVTQAVTSPAACDVYFDGIIAGFTGLTPGARQYLSATAGARTETPPTGAGVYLQYIGIALSATEIEFDPSDIIVQA